MIFSEGGFNVVSDGRDMQARFVAELVGGESYRFDSRVHEMPRVSWQTLQRSQGKRERDVDGTVSVQRRGCV